MLRRDASRRVPRAGRRAAGRTARDRGAQARQRAAQARARRLRFLVAGVVAVALVGGAGALYWAGRPGGPPQAGRALWARLESYGPPADFFSHVPRSTLELYALAPAIEADLQYIPCYCGCSRAGHTSNRSCYLQSAPGARPVVWDPHAAG